MSSRGRGDSFSSGGRGHSFSDAPSATDLASASATESAFTDAVPVPAHVLSVVFAEIFSRCWKDGFRGEGNWARACASAAPGEPGESGPLGVAASLAMRSMNRRSVGRQAHSMPMLISMPDHRTAPYWSWVGFDVSANLLSEPSRRMEMAVTLFFFIRLGN